MASPLLFPREHEGVLPAFARRFPFTLIMLGAILVVTASTNSLVRPITPDILSRWGFGFQDLQSGNLTSLLWAPFQILKPYMAITISIGLAIFLGGCELLLGTRRAVVVFWAAHVAGYVGAFALIRIIGDSGFPVFDRLLQGRDVGASNGMFGAGGAAVAYLPGRVRRNLFLGVAAYLILALVIEQQLWDIEHLVAFATGTLLGAIFVRRDGQGWPRLLPRFQLERRQRPMVLAWCLAAMGFVNILEPFVLAHRPGFVFLEDTLPLVIHHAPRHLLLASGFALLVLVPGLARGQRAAWWGSMLILGLSLGVRLHRGLELLEAIPALLFIALFLVWKPQFRAPSDPRAIRRGRRILGVLVAALPLYGVLGLFVLRSQFEEVFTLSEAVREVASRLAFASADTFTPTTHQAAWFLSSIPLVGWSGLVYCTYLVLRRRSAPASSRSEIERARAILRSHGRNSTGSMTLWPGNTIFLDPARESFLAYRVCSGMAVVLGDPIGPVAALDPLLRRFAGFCRSQGWGHCFHAAGAGQVDLYRQLGYELLQIGEEAVIPLAHLEFKGRKWQTMRSAFNRAERDGVRFAMYEGGTLPADLREQAISISREWEAERKLPPMGFTLGTVADLDDPTVNVAVAVDASGRVHAFADWLPIPARRGWVIDLMRRGSESMSGVMEFLIGSSMLAFRERGYDLASLATAPLADLDRNSNPSLIPKVMGAIYERFDMYYPFQSLFEYKEKFQPTWEPTYLVYQGTLQLPAVGRALVEAYLPDLDALEIVRILGAGVGEVLERRGEKGESSGGAPTGVFGNAPNGPSEPLSAGPSAPPPSPEPPPDRPAHA